MMHRDRLPSGGSTAALADETARVLSAVDLLVSDILHPQRLAFGGNHKAATHDGAAQLPTFVAGLQGYAVQSSTSGEAAVATGNGVSSGITWAGAAEEGRPTYAHNAWTAAATQPEAACSFHRAAGGGGQQQRPSAAVRAVGSMCAPDVRSCGDQYGEGWATMTRSIGVETDAVWRGVEEAVPVVPPVPIVPTAATTRAVGLQTQAASVRHTSTEPIPAVSAGTITEVHGGDIVEVAHFSKAIRSTLDTLCGALERTVQQATSSSARRVACMAASKLAVLGSAVVHWRSECTALRTQSERSEHAVASLQHQLDEARVLADDRDKEIATWRRLCEEMAQSAETTSAENEKLRHHVAFLETIVDRFETAMASHPATSTDVGAAQSGNNVGADGDEDGRHPKHSDGPPASAHCGQASNSRRPAEAMEAPRIAEVSVLPHPMAGRRPPRGPTHISPSRRASTSPPSTTSPHGVATAPSLQVVLDLYRQCEAALSLDALEEADV